MTPLPELVAHRGNAREYPENTLPAFASALALGVRALELDVQLSADGVPVVIHDHALERTTGHAGTVFELPAAQLAALDAGEPQRFGTRFRGTRLPLLTEALALIATHDQALLFVEIKRASLRRFGQEPVVSAVVEALRPQSAQCVAISFDRAAVACARALGHARIGWVLSDFSPQARAELEALQPQFVFGDVAQVPPEGALWPGPWRWVIYEVDALATALALARRGAHYVETMAVAELGAALRTTAAGAIPGA